MITLFATKSRAEQFVLFDAKFTFTWDDAMNSSPSKSHFYVTEKNFLNKMRPANLASPINYGAGTVHIHLEVLDKPAGTQQAGWALCYVDHAGHDGCPYTDYYTKTGVYEKNADMRTFYNAATLNWASGVSEVDLVYTINGSGSGHITNYPALKDLVTPTTVRIALVQVSPGSTYDPRILPGGDVGMDAGIALPDGGAPDATAHDAPPPLPDATDNTGGGGNGSGTGGSGNPAGGAGGADTQQPPATTGAGGQGGGGSAGTGTNPPVRAPDGSNSGLGCTVAPGGGGRPMAALPLIFAVLWARGWARGRRRRR